MKRRAFLAGLASLPVVGKAFGKSEDHSADVLPEMPTQDISEFESAKGIELASANGFKFRVTVDDNGMVVTEAIS